MQIMLQNITILLTNIMVMFLKQILLNMKDLIYLLVVVHVHIGALRKLVTMVQREKEKQRQVV